MSKYKVLEVGQVYKSYRQVCEALGAKVEAGNSKKAQIKEWECHFSYEKQGNKFVILEVFDTPKEKEDLRKEGRNGVYGEFVQLLILDYLALCKGHVTVGGQRLMQTIGMINRNYSECRSNHQKLADYSNVNIKVVHDFYNTTSKNFKKTIESALDKLVNKRIIFYSDIVKVKKTEESYTSVATPFQLQKIMSVEKEELIKLGYNEISEVRNSSNWYTFNNNVKNKLKAELEIDYYYNAYDISINVEYLEREKKLLFEYILDKIERNENKTSLNSLVMDRVNENAQKRSNDAFNASKYLSRIRSSDTYVGDIESLSKLLLSKNTSYMVSEIMKTPSKVELDSDTQKQIDELF